MEKYDKALLALAALSLIDALIFVIFYSDPNFTANAMILTAVFSIFAATASYFALTCHGIESDQGKLLLYMFLGNIMWALGEISWAFDTYIGLEVANVSSLDILYYLGYAFILYGFYLLWKMTRNEKSSFMGWAVFLATLVIMLGANYVVVGGELYDPEVSLAENLVVNGYSYLDFALVASVLSIIAVMRKTRQTNAWLIVMAGFVATGIADIMYSMTISTAELHMISEFIWQVSYILTAAGFIVYYKSIKEMAFAIMKKAHDE